MSKFYIAFFQKVDNCKLITRKLSLCQLLRVHWIIIQKVTSLYRPLLKYWIDFAWKCNFNIRSINLHARMQAHQARDRVLGALCVFSCLHVHLLMRFRAHVCFSENLAWLVFFKHPFWDSPFCLITDELRVTHFICTWWRYCYCHFVISISLFKERRKL